MQNIKIFLLIPTLSGGGSERVMVHLIRNIDRRKFDPCLVLFEKKGRYIEDLPSNIQIFELEKGGYKYGFQWLILFKLRKLIEKQKPDIILSFMWYTNIIAILALYLSRVKCEAVISERYGLAFSLEGWLTELLRRFTIRFLYPKADKIIVNSEKMGFQLSQMFKIQPGKITVIYNPVDIQEATLISRKETNHPWYKEDVPILIAIGRLTPQKGFSYLIKALHLVIAEGINCRLLILGEGVEKEKLKKLAIDLQVDDKVAFLGFQKNPYKYLARSTIFVLSSLYEGFPNVLLEALALGVPSIATRCPTGPEEIITDGVDGILVPPADERVLTDVIKKLLQDENLRKRLGEAGRKRAEDFRVEKIIKQYEDVIEAVCAESAER